MNECCRILAERHAAELAKEMERRCYYQDIVYSVCNSIDRIYGFQTTKGHGVVCGTLETPTKQVQEAMLAIEAKGIELAAADQRWQELLAKAETKHSQEIVAAVEKNQDDWQKYTEQLAKVEAFRKPQERCNTSQTERFENPQCLCGTYAENLGPCQAFLTGANGRCAYCDHEVNCHVLRVIESKIIPLPRDVKKAIAAGLEDGHKKREAQNNLENGDQVIYVTYWPEPMSKIHPKWRACSFATRSRTSASSSAVCWSGTGK